MKHIRLAAAAAFLTILLSPPQAKAAPQPPKSPKSVRLYVFDCGTIKAMSVTLYNFKEGEIPARDHVVPCYMVVHPKGILMWDVGVVPDSAFPAGGGPVTQGISTARVPLKTQMAAVGYQPSEVKYLAFSHYHSDHTANANEFANATWLTRENEKDAMFAEKPPRIVQPATFSALRNSKTIILKDDEYDVFGDHTVIIKYAPGHTPGHQTLLIRFKKTGPVLIAGDLYHFPEEKTMNRFPTFEYDAAQSAVTRKDIDAYVEKNHAQMWIEHDLATFEKLKKAPEYYE
jgi:N-acyl homoserine lactone hydrolase